MGWVKERYCWKRYYLLRERQRTDPTASRARKTVASRFYQFRMNKAPTGPYLAETGPYLAETGQAADDSCWWCDRGVPQTREHLLVMGTARVRSSAGEHVATSSTRQLYSRLPTSPVTADVWQRVDAEAPHSIRTVRVELELVMRRLRGLIMTEPTKYLCLAAAWTSRRQLLPDTSRRQKQCLSNRPPTP
jgi:hypothetical protein